MSCYRSGFRCGQTARPRTTPGRWRHHLDNASEISLSELGEGSRRKRQIQSPRRSQGVDILTYTQGVVSANTGGRPPQTLNVKETKVRIFLSMPDPPVKRRPRVRPAAAGLVDEDLARIFNDMAICRHHVRGHDDAAPMPVSICDDGYRPPHIPEDLRTDAFRFRRRNRNNVSEERDPSSFSVFRFPMPNCLESLRRFPFRGFDFQWSQIFLPLCFPHGIGSPFRSICLGD